jgi:hypothetical protein
MRRIKINTTVRGSSLASYDYEFDEFDIEQTVDSIIEQVEYYSGGGPNFICFTILNSKKRYYINRNQIAVFVVEEVG